VEKNLKIALILSATDRASAVMGKVFARAEAGAKRLSTFSAGLGRLGTQGIVAGGVITAFFGKTLKDAGEAAKATRRLNAAFDNLGSKGKEMAEQGKKFAEAYQFKIGVNDDEIQAAETRLAVFHKIFTENARQAKIFERATKAAFDMKALGFGDDAATNAQKLGKLLNDPLNNLNSMGKVLGRITPLQKKHVLLLYEQNRATEAQSYVLGLVEKRFQNAGEKTRTMGDLMRVQMHELSIEIGNQLRPAYTALLTKITEILPKVMSFVKSHQGLIVAMAKGAVFLLLFSSGIKLLSFGLSGIATVAKVAQWGIANFGNIVAWSGRVSAFAGQGYLLGARALRTLQYEAIFNVIPAMKAMGSAVVRFGMTLLASPITWYILAAVALAAVVYLVIKNWSKISAFFQRLWAGVKSIMLAAWEGIKWVFFNFTPEGLIIKHWSKIASFFTGLWASVKNVFASAWNWIAGLAGRFVQAGRNIVTSIAKGVWAVAMAPVRAIMWIVKKIRNFLPFSPAKEGPLRDIHRVKIAETIAASINAKPMVVAWSRATRSLYNQMNRPSAIPATSSTATTSVHFNPIIHMHGGAVADAEKISERLSADFERLMKNHERNQIRKNF
jgi:phage-related protein